MRIGAALLVVGVLAAAVVYGLSEGVYHFDTVHAGVLYRSGQPRGNGLDCLVRDFRIRTVISLREDRPQEAWWQEEEQACRRLGVRMVHIPMEDRNRPSDEKWRMFLQTVTDPANWPVLVHCEAGSARTGVMVAGYRIAVQGWKAPRALTEAARQNFDVATHPDQAKFLEELAEKHRQADESGEDAE